MSAVMVNLAVWYTLNKSSADHAARTQNYYDALPLRLTIAILLLLLVVIRAARPSSPCGLMLAGCHLQLAALMRSMRVQPFTAGPTPRQPWQRSAGC